MDLTKIQFGGIWTVVTGIALGIMYMFNTFATAEEVRKEMNAVEKKLIETNVRLAYGQYYDRLDDYDESVAEGNDKLAKEYQQQMEMLVAYICEHDPEWAHCREAD